MTDALVLDPDVTTCHFDKENTETADKQNCLKNLSNDKSPALMMSLNFKNPPGRLLRR